MASDAALLRASREGDQQAFGRLVRRYQSLVCTVTYSSTGDLPASEDLAQETFITAWKRLESLRDPSRLRAWLCAIARNVAVDWLRRRQRDVTSGAVSVEQAGPLESPAPTPVERSLSAERASVVWGALNQMPEGYRIPLVLYYREQQSVGRVAKALDLSRSAVKLRLMRGRGMLKEKVAALVEETLTTTGPGDTFAVAVAAALAGVAGKKAAGAGSAILGLSLAKAAAIGAVAVGVAVGGGVALHGLTGPRLPEQAPAAIAAEPPGPEAAPPASPPPLIYAQGLPAEAFVLCEVDLRGWVAALRNAQAVLGDSIGWLTVEQAVKNMCATDDPSTVDVAQRMYFVIGRKRQGSPTILYGLADAGRYQATLPPELTKGREEGGLQVYTAGGTPPTVLLVDTVARWAAVGPDPEEALAFMQMVKDGTFPPAHGYFPDVPAGAAGRVARLFEAWDPPDNPFNVLRQKVGIRTAPGAAPPGSWASLIDAAERVASRQVGTLAYAIAISEDSLSLKMQVQPVAGTPLAERLGAKRPGGLGLLKFMPADSLAVLDSQLPDLSGLLPSGDRVSGAARTLQLLGGEAALALGRAPKGSAQLVLAARVRDVKAVQALADSLAGAIAARLAGPPHPGAPALPLRLNRSEVLHNAHVIKVWDFDLTVQMVPVTRGQGQMAPSIWFLSLLGEDLKLYEFMVDDTLILAFGDGMFEKVQQILGGNLADIEHAARFKTAMAPMPAQPNVACYAEGEKLAAWLAEIVHALAPLEELKIEDGPPAVLAGHFIGRDVLEVAVRVPFGAVRVFAPVQKAMAPPRPAPPAPPPQAMPAAPQPAPSAPALHRAAAAGDRAEAERLLAAGADVNARAPDGRTPLHYAAEQGRLEVVRLLLERRVDVNAEDARRRMPLHLAAEGGHRKVAEALLKAGAEVNSTDLDGWTPTGYAVRAGHRDLADLLTRSGGVE